MSSSADAEYHFYLVARNKSSDEAYVYELGTELLPQKSVEEVYESEEPGAFMFLDGLKFASIFLPDPVAGAILSCIVGIAESFVKRSSTTSGSSSIKLFKALKPYFPEEYSKILEGVELLDPRDDPDEENRFKIVELIGSELKLLLKELQDPPDDPEEENRFKIKRLTGSKLKLLLKELQDPPDDPDEELKLLLKELQDPLDDPDEEQLLKYWEERDPVDEDEDEYYLRRENRD